MYMVRGRIQAITRTCILSIILASFLFLVVFPREPIRASVGPRATSSPLQFMKRISRTRYLLRKEKRIAGVEHRRQQDFREHEENFVKVERFDPKEAIAKILRNDEG